MRTVDDVASFAADQKLSRYEYEATCYSMSSSAVLKISQRLMMEEQTPLLGEKMEIPRGTLPGVES